MVKLGKTTARPGAVKLKFSMVANAAALPTPPAAFGHFADISSWGDLGNTTWGDCVWAGAAHEHMLWTKVAGLPPATFVDIDCLSDYSVVTGFSFSEDTDNGTDMEVAASYRRKTGVLDALGQRHLIDAYMAVTPGDLSEMFLAAYLFGAVGVGINFPDSAEDQFNKGEPWSVVPGSRLVGGHYIPVVGRAANGNALAITWGKLQEVTPDFLSMYNDETIAYFSKEYVDVSLLSPEGFNTVALEGYLNELTNTAT